MLPLLVAASLSLVSATAEDAPLAPVTRLDPLVRPLDLELRLDVDPDRDWLSGMATLDVTLPDARQTIRLHGRNLEVRRARVEGAPASWKQLDADGTAEITAERAVGPGEVRIEIEWRAKLGTALEGAFVVQSEGRRYVATQLEAISARDVFPCFDEPGFKQPIAITMFVDQGDVAVTNTPEVARASLPDGRVRVTFARSEPLPVYLVAFAVGPFDVVEGPVLAPAATRKRALPLRAIVPKGTAAKYGKALEVTAASVRVLEQYTGQGYPFAKLDFVAVPQFAWGGMENAGLIVYSDARIAFDDSASIEQEKWLWGLIAHEVAHQWFGDLVTMKWWDDVWLNEAFATWAAYLVLHELRPELLPYVNLRDRSRWVMDEDSLASARQVREPIVTKADIFDAFDGVTYVKGATVIRMFEGALGPDKFKNGIRAYLSEHRLGNADAHELIDAVSRNARQDVRAAFFSFLDQPGVPFLEAEVRCDGAPRLVFKQSRFLPVGASAARDKSWRVPVCARVDGTERCTVLTSAEGALDLGPGCPKAVLPDSGGRGYYRWSLPAAQLKPLVDGSTRLAAEERVAVADALRAGFLSARLSYADALALALPLANDDNPIVARTPLDLLGFALATIDDEKLASRARARVVAAYAPVLRKLTRPDDGPRARPPETPEERELALLARRALVTIAEDKESQRALVFQARMRFGLHTGSMEPSALEADLTDVAGAALVAQQPEALDALIARLTKEEDSVNRKHLLGAIGSVTDVKGAERAAALSLSPSLRIHERLSALGGIADDRRTRGTALTWLEAHIEELLPLLPESGAGDLPMLFAGSCTEAEAARVEKLFLPQTARFPIARPVAQAVERIRLCAALKAAHDKSMRAVLTK
jgi:cytosol alanyl aminopeptidase